MIIIGFFGLIAALFRGIGYLLLIPVILILAFWASLTATPQAPYVPSSNPITVSQPAIVPSTSPTASLDDCKARVMVAFSSLTPLQQQMNVRNRNILLYNCTVQHPLVRVGDSYIST